jgi:hypothetical protein
MTDASDFASEIASLETKLEPQYSRLNERLSSMAKVFDKSTANLRTALEKAG